MDRQAIFDKVKRHLLKQGCKSMEDDKSAITRWCMYRGPRGLKCAIGALIPDDLYDPAMEMKSIGQLLRSWEWGAAIEKATGASSDSAADVGFLSKLQNVHDTAPTGPFFLVHCQEELKSVATEFGLRWENP
jgi:hypothetical protein